METLGEFANCAWCQKTHKVGVDDRKWYYSIGWAHVRVKFDAEGAYLTYPEDEVNAFLCDDCQLLADDAPRLLQVAKYALLDIAGLYEELIESHYGDIMMQESVHNTVCDLIMLIKKHSPGWKIPDSIEKASKYCYKCGELFAVHDNGCVEEECCECGSAEHTCQNCPTFKEDDQC